ncbi:cysteine desulfurase family protein [Carnobacterium divergens]|uniref:cysteine desulfurase family protein n=1 Tax=Carnobacterium divergens TaxID=2748 RepID=UPI00128D020E|nr:cysteine desulfurase family protein [Carnobacterium divergens]MPQ21640.1 cysteine desulfurase [Carnobacterium divergens]
MIYFDNSATTKIDDSVLKTYLKVSEEIMGNPSSLHGLGDASTGLLQQARKQIAELLNTSMEEIYFTSGGTEGDNWAVKGTAIEKRKFGKHLITTAIEHPAVKESMEQLKMLGFDITYLPVNKEGVVSVKALKKELRSDTTLVSIMAVNNEIGSVQPLEEIGEVLKSYPKVHFHVDAVQAIGKIPLDLSTNSRIDIATFSGHKFHAPRGTGFMYLKKGKKLAPLLNGGGQESGKRSGTENVAGITALSKALRLVLTDPKEKQLRQLEIKEYLMDQLDSYAKVTLFSTKEGAPHILCFALRGIRGEVMVHAFEKKGIYISTTSACSSRSQTSGSTLSAMHVPENIATSAVRVSLNDTNTIEEAQQFIKEFDALYRQFRDIH